MRIGIGIGTGGTYTDAVLYDYEQHTVLAAAKSPTTRSDLSVGILGALDQLPLETVRKAELISLSTTLTTNACVENKLGRSKLIFFGGDRNTIDRYGKAYGLPPSSEMLIQESFTHFSGEVNREPDWELFEQNISQGIDQLDGVGIVEIYAIKNGAVVERAAKERFRARYDLPVICGHELFSELNSLQRASSTLLNASLIGVIKAFMDAIQAAMRQRKIHVPVVIVRSDGSLMSEEFARVHPVETLLCGPAASVLGGCALAEKPNCIIVDIGGTTTDIALMRGGMPVKVLNGVRIGSWKTLVDGLYIKTIGLGGDTAIHYQDKKLVLESYRVKPICALAAEYPSVLESLRLLGERKHGHTCSLHEHYLLVKDIADSERYTEEEKAFCAALRDGPLSVKDAAESVGRDVYTLDVSRLIREGVVQLCGFTPTDVMHLTGDYSLYPAEAARLAAEFTVKNLELPVEELCDQVYESVRRRLYANIAEALLENKYPRYMRDGVGPEVRQFIQDSYELARLGGTDEFLTHRFDTGYSLLGVGAPTAVFLPEVAKLLGTEAVIPKHHEVANALGAIVGNISATGKAEIQPNYNTEGITGYTVFCKDTSRQFDDYNTATEFALREAEKAARIDAERRGAKGHIAVTSRLVRHEGNAREETIYLGTTAVAQAVGSVGAF